MRGWKIVDFEGEPAKPLAERALPDSRWRDVAGMLRSFDYAPRVVERSLERGRGRRHRAARRTAPPSGGPQPHGLPRRVRRPRPLPPTSETLLAAYVADKAVYETVYETRNRPSWVAIPLAASRGSEAVMTSAITAKPVPATSSTCSSAASTGIPHAVLGPHPHEGAVTVRVLKPLASEVVVLHDGQRTPLAHEHEGIWAGVLPVPTSRTTGSRSPTTASPPRSTTPTASCRRSARWTCT